MIAKPAKFIADKIKIDVDNNVKILMIEEEGIGNKFLFSGEKPLDILNSVECNYAIKFFEENSFSKWLCNIPDKSLKILRNIN